MSEIERVPVFELARRMPLLQFMKNENEEWIRLCELVANESDPERLYSLLDRLIRALDARNQAICHREDPHVAEQDKPSAGSTV